MTDKDVLRKRIVDNVVVDPDSGCWLWQRTTNGRGYGNMRAGSRGVVRSHRIAYEVFVGPIPDGMVVCHKCDQPLCCNPEHLFADTQANNMRDAVKKGRMYSPRGSSNPASRLTKESVVDIRRLLQEGQQVKDVAAQYGVSPKTISAIKVRRTWTWLT